MRRILITLFALVAIVAAANAATEVTVGNFVYKGPYTFDNENCYNIEKLSDAGKTVTGQLVVPGYVMVSGTRYRVRYIDGLAYTNGAQFSSVKIEYGVQHITRETFRDCARLTSVSLPSSIVEIGQMTFSGCSNLKYLYYAGEGTMNVQAYTFERTPTTKYLYTATNRGMSVLKANSTWTSAFSTITCDPTVAYDFSINGVAYVIKKGIPYNYSSCSVAIAGGNPSNGTVTLNQNISSGLTNSPGSYPIREVVDSAFCGNTNVRTVANHLFLGNKIGKDAFRNCTNLTSVDIAADSIYAYAFYGCRALNSITLHAPNDGGGPNGVHYIGSYAFGCVNATSVTLPTSLEVSGNAPFYHCPNLINISISSSNTKFSCSQGCLYSKDYSRLYQIPEGLTSVSFHPNLQYALNYCGSYNNCALLSFPYGMKSVSSYAFSYMPNLRQVCIPSSMTSINSAAFAGTTSITEVELNQVTPPSSDFLPAALTKSEVKLFIPYDGFETYRTSSIWGQYNIQYDNGDWNECFDFADVNYYTVTASDEVCLVRPSNSTTVSIPNTVTRNGKTYKVTSIGPFAFYDAPTSNFTVTVSSGTNLTKVRDYAFFKNTHLKSFPFESITRIDESAFSGTTGLTGLLRLNNCATIGSYAFSESGLTKLVAEVALTTIGPSAFRECTSLSEVNFANCKNLTMIPGYCFNDCLSLNNFYGPSNGCNITSIGDYAFNRTNISSFPWNKKIARIGVSAFAQTQFEGELDLSACGETGFYLDDMAFSNVNKVTSFILPATTTHVGNASMSTQQNDWYKEAREYEGYPDYSDKVNSYLNLKSVICYAPTPPTIGSGNPWFAKHQQFQRLYVPKESITAYRAAQYWMRFKSVEAILSTTQGDVNGDGVVSGADVTALYNWLLVGTSVNGNPDVNGDGIVSGADVTVLYNLLLN